MVQEVNIRLVLCCLCVLEWLSVNNFNKQHLIISDYNLKILKLTNYEILEQLIIKNWIWTTEFEPFIYKTLERLTLYQVLPEAEVTHYFCGVALHLQLGVS